MQVEHELAIGSCVEKLRRLAQVAGRMSDQELFGPSRCHGWTAGDVLPSTWSDETTVLLGCGRTKLTPDNASRSASSPTASRSSAERRLHTGKDMEKTREKTQPGP